MLTEAAIKAAKPKTKPYKLADERGMYLLVTNAGRYWRLDYRFEGKRKTFALGVYPDASLREAREARDLARVEVLKGIDPGAKRKAEKVAPSDSFESIAREWFDRFKSQWVGSHSDRIIRRLERDIFPWIGARDVRSIKVPDLLDVLRRIEKRGAVETAHRAMQNCSQIFRYGVATGRCDRDITSDLRGAIPPSKAKNHAAIVEPERIAELLRAIDGYSGFFVTRCALALSPLFFVRPGELRHAKWADIDFDAEEWRFTASKTKQQHIVPLSRQATAILRELQAWTGEGTYLFPSARGNKRPMSDNAILAALRRMGYPNDEMTGHGFRAMARTVLDEVLGQRVDWIEHQLAHAVKDPNGRAYNRTAHLPQRHKMMQLWADYLDELRAGKSGAEESG